LGSSDFSARLAANLGLPFAFAAHFAPDSLEQAAHLYRANFRPSDALGQPWLMVAVQVIAADSDAEAERLFTTPQQRFLRLIRNQPVETVPPVDSMDGLWTDWEQAAVQARLRAAIVGSEATTRQGLKRLIGATGADEIIAVTDTWTMRLAWILSGGLQQSQQASRRQQPESRRWPSGDGWGRLKRLASNAREVREGLKTE